MDSFDINRLTDFDFEEVCKDIFETNLNVGLEIFTPGRDSGIDLRYIAPNNRSSLVIQCKHWPQSTSAKLVRHLKKVELPKIERLKPERYILVTSARLSPSAKDQIRTALQPHIKSPGDIYGLHEISELLKQHPEIVRRHMRLWLSSTAILQSLLNKNLLTRSSDLAQEIRRTALIYVPNPSQRRALAILEQQHVCIISGIPGIGKTSLAQMLACEYADQGYEVYEVSEDADEINAAWDEKQLQLFFYDDFLGQTMLDDKLHKNEDSRLIRLLRRINRSPNKRLILTTREYIMEQARQRYERIGSEDFNPMTCILALADYTNLIRAEILYNHIYFSELPSEGKAFFAQPEAYNAIISNSKFNPRLIDSSIRLSVSRGLNGEEVSQEILKNLISPYRLWDHIVQNQLNELQVQILIALFSLPPKIPLESLVQTIKANTNHEFNEQELRRSLKVLESTMTQSTSFREGVITVGFHNPSIRDYMREYVFRSFPILRQLLQSTVYFEQVEQLWQYFTRWSVATEIMKRPEMRQEIIRSAIRTYNRPATSQSNGERANSDEVFRRSGVALQMAQTLNSNEIKNLVYSWLKSVDIYSCVPNTDDVLALIIEMIQLNVASNQRPKLLRARELIDYLTEDLTTWDTARYALFALEEIQDSAKQSFNLARMMSAVAGVVELDTESRALSWPQFAYLLTARIDKVDVRVEEEARDAINRVNITGVIPSWLISSMDEIIQYADDFSNAEDMFPGYTNVKSIHGRNAEIANSDKSPLVVVGETSSDDRAVIDRIFSMLSELAELGEGAADEV